MRTRRRRSATFHILVAVGSAGCAALAHVWVHSQVVQVGYDIAREQRSVEELTQANQRLRIEVDWLKNPARVEEIARRELKMEPPDPTRIRVISGRLTADNAENRELSHPTVLSLRSARSLR